MHVRAGKKVHMKTMLPMFVLCPLLVASAAVASEPSMSAMQGNRRVLLISSPCGESAPAEHQHRILTGWKREADDRDVTLVEVAGTSVVGASDAAWTLRMKYRLPAKGFQALLIGKDGHIALRSSRPISAQTLQGTIDAMPMRRDGKR
jgi:hypothetical protein